MEIVRDVVLQEVKELVLSGRAFQNKLQGLYDKYKGHSDVLGELGQTDPEIQEEVEKLQVVMNDLEM
jgi:translation initiation factor 2 beta subunit (eIF-2beta)/eIF-5